MKIAEPRRLLKSGAKRKVEVVDRVAGWYSPRVVFCRGQKSEKKIKASNNPDKNSQVWGVKIF